MDLTVFFGLIVVFVAGAISGVTAFGFALIAVPPLLVFYDPPTVTALIILLVMVTRWVVLRDSWRHISWWPVMLIMPTALAGAVLGTQMVKSLDSAYLELVASAVVVMSASMLLFGWTIPGTASAAACPVAGLVCGALATSTGMAGPPVVLLFAARGYPSQVFRGSLTVISYMLGAVSLTLLIREDLIGRSDLTTWLVLLPAAAVGTWAGQRTLHRFSPHQFNRVVLLLLMATGIAGLALGFQRLLG